jgi:H+/Cl- antiporter ClcA
LYIKIKLKKGTQIGQFTNSKQSSFLCVPFMQTKKASGTLFSQIRKAGKYIFDLVTHDSIKVNFLRAIPFWFASLVAGLVAVAYAKLFNYGERFLQFMYQWQGWIIFILTPLCFLIGWWVVNAFAKNARGSGIPQVMAAIELATPKNNHLVDRLLSLRIIVVKIISSLVMVSGGAAIGREGPTIQISGSIFRLVNKWIPASWPRLSKQSFIMTGAAAGLAAAFNTPLGGIVFAVEELARIHIRFIRTALFTAIIIAGLTAQGLLGPYLYLGYPDVNALHFSTYFAVAATAVIASVVAAFMSKMILRIMKWRSTIKSTSKIVAIVLFSGLLVACIAYFFDFAVLGSGKALMTRTLFTPDKQLSWTTVVARFAGTIISFSSGAAGGVFAPALAVGASIGGYLSALFHFVNADANILILSGMVAFLTGVTRTPFTSAILVLEMTDRHSVIFHLMLAAMIASMAALLVDKNSFYEQLKKQYVEELEKSDDSSREYRGPILDSTVA